MCFSDCMNSSKTVLNKLRLGFRQVYMIATSNDIFLVSHAVSGFSGHYMFCTNVNFTCRLLRCLKQKTTTKL